MIRSGAAIACKSTATRKKNMSNPIVVLGSANVDMIMKMSRLPRRGETITNAEFLQTLGGKGANQAIAAARAGGAVSFIGCVGDDPGGAEIRQSLATAGIGLEFLFTASGIPSGAALVMIGQDGDNYLSVAPGSNACLGRGHVDRSASLLGRAAIIVLQCEIPLDTLQYVLELAARHRRTVLLNLAPAQPLDPQSLRQVACLVVNESEAEFLCGFAVDGLDKASSSAAQIQESGPPVVIVTLGAQGAWVADGPRGFHVPALRVHAVDATAAGDVFCGSLAVALAEAMSLDEGVRFASAAAAIAVTRLGAQPSIPYREEILRFLGQDLKMGQY
jgi:ribokinase